MITLSGMNAVSPQVSADSADVAARFAQGDSAAFDELHRMHNSELLSYLMTRLNHRARAEDVLQEVWMKAWKSRTAYQDGSFRGWIYQITRNTLVDDCRKQNRQKEQSAEEQLESGTHADPAVTLVRQDELQAFEDCVEEVGGDFVDVLLRVKIHRESPAVVADEIGMQRGTIYSRINRATQQLADCVENKLQ